MVWEEVNKAGTVREKKKDKVHTLKIHSISNLHCCTRKRRGALTALHWLLNFYA